MVAACGLDWHLNARTTLEVSGVDRPDAWFIQSSDCVQMQSRCQISSAQFIRLKPSLMDEANHSPNKDCRSEVDQNC